MSHLSKRYKDLIQKAVIVGFVVGALAAFGRVIYLDGYYHSDGAKRPEPATGKIYEKYVHHGSRVYLTRGEQIEFEIVLPGLFISLFGTAFWLNSRWKQFYPFKESK